MSSSAHGNPRSTRDIDIVVDIPADYAHLVYLALQDEFEVDKEEINRVLATPEPFRAFQALDKEELFKVDCFVLNPDAYSQVSFARREEINLAPDLKIWCAAPEDVILRKIQWYLLGNRVSDRQWNDIVGVIEVRGETLDWAYLDKWAERLDIAEVLAEARAERRA